MIWLKNKLIF